MKKMVAALATAGALSVAGATERLVDPFERHGPNYVLEYHTDGADALFSTNWYDAEGLPHDDKTTDALLLLAIASGGALLTVKTVQIYMETPDEAPAA